MSSKPVPAVQVEANRDDQKFEIPKKVAGLLLLYAIVSVILVKLLAELAFAGPPV